MKPFARHLPVMQVPPVRNEPMVAASVALRHHKSLVFAGRVA